MKFSLNKILLSTCALTLSMAVYALAPVEDVTETQNVMTGELVPSDHSQAQVSIGPSPERGSAPIEESHIVVADAGAAPKRGSVTDNNPLISPENTANTQEDDTSSNDTDVTAPASSPAIDLKFASKSLSERTMILHQQLQNLNQENLSQQVSQLQTQIQQLSGELQSAQRDIKLLEKQQRQFYQDLQNKIKQVSNVRSDDNDTSTDTKSSPNILTAPSVKPAPAKKAAPLKDATSFLDNSSNDTVDLTATSKYKIALNELMHKRYDPALKHFKQYLADYPGDRLAANAHYWLGEICVLKRNLPEAIKQFNIVTKQFPQSNKVADAKVKLAIIDASQGNESKARRAFVQIKRQYPGTTAAQLASIQLQQLS